MNDASIGLELKNLTAESSKFRVVETAPPPRPLSLRPPRKVKPNAAQSEPKTPRVQLWGEMRVLRVRDVAEARDTVIFEATCAREEAFSASFAQALASPNDSATVSNFASDATFFVA